MKKELRTVVYDEDLRIEAYHFEGFVRPFPNHFHEYYVIGYLESGQRALSCMEQEYSLRPGNILLFNPGDSHACAQSDGGTLDYRGLTFPRKSFWTGWKRLMEPGSCQSSPPVLSSTRKLLPACVLFTSWS